MKSKRKLLLFVGILLLIISIITVKVTRPTVLENDTALMPNTEFDYYINVTYDGVDVKGTTSSTSTTADVNSGYIFVEDKIPEGLTFVKFIGTSDGSIGAVTQDGSRSCLGNVVDGVSGLNYDTETNLVSFKVQNLQAGCQVTVGVKTMVPGVDDPNTETVETRRDFYNYATAKEDNNSVKSNTVHTWIGNSKTAVYNVVYKYSGTVPGNAPELPDISSYSSGSLVNVAANPMIDNYTFSGWTSSDVTISNNKFNMPTKNITLTGSFTANKSYDVTYQIVGKAPDNYVVPTTKAYYVNNTVKLDTLAAGDILNGYKFLGWSSSVPVGANKTFLMPSEDVVITGSFEELKYNVCYEFVNSSIVAPACTAYKAGSLVNLVDIADYLTANNIVTSDKFLGWDKETSFLMPAYDLTVTGSWQTVTGYFEPKIELIASATNDAKKYLDVGDNLVYKLKITNDESFAIKDVIVKLNDLEFFSAADFQICNKSCNATKNYEIINNNTIKIYEIPANSNFQSTDFNLNKTLSSGNIGNTITLSAEMISAISDNDYILRESTTYKQINTKNMKSKVKVCSQDLSNKQEQIFQYHITSENIDETSENYYDAWFTLYSSECQTIYLPIGTYKFEQITPQEYVLNSVSGAISSNGATFDVALNQTYSINFVNQYNRKKYFHSYGRVINKILSMIGVN